MRAIVNFITILIFSLLFSHANAESMQEWCDKNERLCTAAINTCEANSNLDCDAYMEKIKRGDVADLGKKKGKPN